MMAAISAPYVGEFSHGNVDAVFGISPLGYISLLYYLLLYKLTGLAAALLNLSFPVTISTVRGN